MKRKPGKIYVNLLNQTEIWWTRQGKMVNVDEMDERHVKNLIRYLDRNTKRLHNAMILSTLRTSLGPYPDDEHWWESDTDPEFWMKSRPLYKKLEQMRDAQFQKDLRRTILGDEGKE